MNWQLHDAILEMKCLEEELRFVGGECEVMMPEAQLHILHERIYGQDDTGRGLNA